MTFHRSSRSLGRDRFVTVGYADGAGGQDRGAATTIISNMIRFVRGLWLRGRAGLLALYDAERHHVARVKRAALPAFLLLNVVLAVCLLRSFTHLGGGGATTESSSALDVLARVQEDLHDTKTKVLAEIRIQQDLIEAATSRRDFLKDQMTKLFGPMIPEDVNEAEPKKVIAEPEPDRKVSAEESTPAVGTGFYSTWRATVARNSSS